MNGAPTFRLPGQTKPVACLGAECAYRPCLWVREFPGTFVQGRGYRGATKDLICGTREARGCPTPLPPLDAEKVRCCVAPRFHPAKAGRRPTYQACITCGARAEGIVLGLRRTLLPTAEPSRCRHTDAPGGTKGAHAVEGADPAAWTCSRCDAWWDAEPKAHQAGEDGETFHLRRWRMWHEKFIGPVTQAIEAEHIRWVRQREADLLSARDARPEPTL